IPDGNLEPDENFFVEFTPLAGEVTFNRADQKVEVTILNDDVDSPGEIVVPGDMAVLESTGTITLWVERITGTLGDIDLGYEFQTNTTQGTLDYTATNGNLSWGNGVGGKQPISVTIVDDGTFEPNESFIIKFTLSGADTFFGGDDETEVTILDDGAPAETSEFSLPGDITVTEFVGNATMTVTRTQGTHVPVTIECETLPGTPGPFTATPFSDYVGLRETLTWDDPTVMEQSYIIYIVPDDGPEEVESLTIQCSAITPNETFENGNSAISVSIRSEDLPYINIGEDRTVPLAEVFSINANAFPFISTLNTRWEWEAPAPSARIYNPTGRPSDIEIYEEGTYTLNIMASVNGFPMVLADSVELTVSDALTPWEIVLPDNRDLTLSETNTEFSFLVGRKNGSPGRVGLQYEYIMDTTDPDDFTDLSKQSIAWDGPDQNDSEQLVPMKDDPSMEAIETARIQFTITEGNAFLQAHAPAVRSVNRTITIRSDDILLN
ncbi:hypothetical protein BVX98_02035, partial [bacterium F11]